VVRFIRPYCDPDPFLYGQPEYTITSLYFDTQDLLFYHQKRVHQCNRIKLRIRTYGQRAEGPVFLELKRRFRDVMVKTRARVPRESFAQIACGPGPLPDLGLRGGEQAVVEDFRLHVHNLQLRPVISIRYDREPYVGRTDPGVRVTFDRRLRYASTKEVVIPQEDRDYYPFDYPSTFFAPESRVVLEIKFDEYCPVWVQDLVRHFDIARESFSKYCNGLDQIQNRHWTYNPRRLVSLMG